MRPDPNASITFYGQNSLVYFSGATTLNLLIEIYTNNILFMGSGIGTGRIPHHGTYIRLLESKNIIVGSEVMFGRGVCLRNGDGHILYDRQSLRRINPSQSVIIGDRAWIGQDVLILKGSLIGCGVMIGAGSIVSNKTIQEDCIWVGPPGKVIRDNILIDRTSTAQFTDTDTKRYNTYRAPESKPKLIGMETLQKINSIDSTIDVMEKFKLINEMTN